MAQTKTIISVETGQAVKNIQELKDNIKLYKEQLKTLELGSEEYQETLTALNQNQVMLKNAMHGTSATMKQLTDTATGANVAFDENNKLIQAESLSYNELVAKLAELKKQWRATTDEQQRAQLGEQINSVNDQLKGMDASVGNFQRNVGNYLGSMEQMASSLGLNFTKLTKGAKNFGNGLEMIGKAGPMLALTLLVKVIDQVIKALNTSEDNTQALTAAMAPLQAITDLVTKALQGMGKIVVWVAEKMGKLINSIMGTNEVMSERNRLAKEEIELTKQQRETTIQNAEAERDVAELRAKATERLKYSAKERIAFLEEAGRKEAEISKRAVEDAKKQYEIIRDRNALTESSTEEKDKEAEAYAAMVRAETSYYESMRRINSGIVSARQEEIRMAREAAKAVKDAATAKLNADAEYNKRLLELATEGTEEYLALQNEQARLEYEKAREDAKQKITDQADLQRTLIVLEKAYHQDVEKNNAEHLAYLQEQRDQAAKAQAEAQAKAREEEKQRQALALEDEQIYRSMRLLHLQEGSTEYLAAEMDLKKYELDTIHQLEDESETAFRARQLEAEKAYYAAKKAHAEAWVSSLGQVVGNVSGIFSSIADFMESNTDMTEKQARQAKNLRIASATIDMLQGAVTAYAQAQSLGVPLGPIVGATNAAAVIAAGTANIAKIKAQDVNKESTTTSASATIPAQVYAPVTAPSIPQTTTLTTASEEDRLNRMASQRVYILSSDLEADRNSTRARVTETTF